MYKLQFFFNIYFLLIIIAHSMGVPSASIIYLTDS